MVAEQRGSARCLRARCSGSARRSNGGADRRQARRRVPAVEAVVVGQGSSAEEALKQWASAKGGLPVG